MRRRSVRLSAVAVALVAALVTAGCSRGGASSSSSSSSSGHLEKTNLTVAAVPASDSAALYIAKRRGMFAAAGLHVKIVPAISGATVIARQEKGVYDVTLGNYVSYILANALHGAHFRVLAAASTMGPRTQELVVPAGSPIRSIHDLAGKKVGVNVLDNIGTLLIRSALTDNAMPDNSVRFVTTPFPQMAAKLKAHQVDAAWLPAPFITGAQLQIGAQTLVDLDQGDTQNLPIGGLMVTQKWEQEYPHTAAAFRRVVVKAQAIAAENLGAVQRGMAAYSGVSQMTAALSAPPGFPVTTRVQPIQRIANLMLRFGMLKHPFNVSKMIS